MLEQILKNIITIILRRDEGVIDAYIHHTYVHLNV